MGTRNDDISLILAKAKKQGFLPDVYDSEIDILTAESTSMFGADAALNTSYGKPKNQRVVVIGDSIDAGSDSNSTFFGGSWASYLAVRSNQKFHLVDNKGIGGQDTNGILARLQTDVIANNPGIVVFAGSTNDRNGGQVTPAKTKENFISAVAQLRAAGIQPVLHTAPPTDIAGGSGPGGTFNTIALNRAAISSFNTWLVGWAKINNIPVLDFYKFWVDPATGGWLAGYTGDGVHPNNTGLTALLDGLLAEGLPSLFNGVVNLAVSNADPNNVANALCLTGNPPSTWYFPDPAAISTSAATKGNWLEINTTAASKIAYSPSIPVNTGDVVSIAGKFKKTDTITTTIQLQDQTYTAKATPMNNWSPVITDGTFYMEYVVQAGVTSVMAAISNSAATGKTSVSQLTIRNRTALGI